MRREDQSVRAGSREPSPAVSALRASIPDAQHTPGPWDAVGLTVYDTCMDGVASCHSADDARLIAAAPELLADLEFAVKLLRPFGATAQVQRMEATIAKARGSEQ